MILAGYKKIGKAFLKKIEGFFSILILDMRENKIVITVDPQVVNLFTTKRIKILSL